ncbi:MAG: hypothetical protein IKI09_06890 [Bacteroidales bacterium]|nr:hypothetical protein [Bacteroidales bacterium]
MKYIHNLLLVVCLMMISIQAFSQAKKPQLVVVPSDALMNQMGLLQTTDDMGEVNYVQDYKKAFLDTDLKACISKISEMFNDRGFPLTMLEAQLRNAQGRNIPITIDLRLELNYKINKQGPRDILYFELSAIDAYSSKQVAATSGQSKPAIGETKVNLLQEAVIDKIDKFAFDLDIYFESLVQFGRESRLTIESEEPLPDDLIDIVEEWLTANCVNGVFSTDNIEENIIQISQAMMPLYNASGTRTLDARNFYRPLLNVLKMQGLNAKQEASKNKSFSVGGILGDGHFIIE